MAWTRRFLPAFDGTIRLGQLRAHYLEQVADRVRHGLLSQAPESRNRYRILSRSSERLRFEAESLLTGINVGLNQVELTCHQRDGVIHYRVHYWTWARYVLILSLALVLALGLVLSLPLLGLDLVDPKLMPKPRELLVFGLPLAIFWGLVWPWILIALHKGPAERYLQRILEEVNQNGVREPGCR